MLCPKPDIGQLNNDLLKVRQFILDMEDKRPLPEKILEKHSMSAINLQHYLALRALDLRELQVGLSDWGLSSFARAERKVLATLDAVLFITHQLLDQDWEPEGPPPICFDEARKLLESNSVVLLGPQPESRRARIMVTMPSEAADNYELVESLIAKGMNCARINCAHDSELVWKSMIDNIKKASEKLDSPCKILMDIAGPKLRTSSIIPTPMVVKVRPKRNELGVVVEPARVRLYDPANALTSSSEEVVHIPVEGEWLSGCEEGHIIKLEDSRGSKRKLRVVKVDSDGVEVEFRRTIYFIPGLQLINTSSSNDIKVGIIQSPFPEVEGVITLHRGDKLVVRRDSGLGHGPFVNYSGELINAAIGCSIPEFLSNVKVGEPIWLDDGKIGGVIQAIDNEKIEVHITQAKENGTKLRGHKGINLPASAITMGALTQKDVKDLEFVLQHADMIGYSFVNSSEDIEALILAMDRIKRSQGRADTSYPGVVIKIETEKGFNDLPEILLAAMRLPSIGVMIARGDLAIECGFGRLAELQEEILWICEAAHVPVIWATQVLEGMAKAGLPSRAEVTDAAMGQRAECIMLNKGTYIVDATRSLDEILRRMQDHQTKKRSWLRKLNIAESYFERDVTL